MRHGALCRMVFGVMVASLIYSSSPAWAGAAGGGGAEPQIGYFDPIQVPPRDPSTQDVGSILWDNGDFDGTSAVSSQCGTPVGVQDDCVLECNNFGTSASDFQIDAGSIVRGVDCTFATFNPPGGPHNEIFGWIVTFYRETEDGGDNPGDPIPDVNNILDCFVTSVDGEVFDRGGGVFDFQIEFEGGDAHVSGGDLTWVSVVPVVESGPQMGFGAHSAGRLLSDEALRFTGLDPDFHDLSDPIFDPPIRVDGFAYKLRGEPPRGGSTVVTFSPPGADPSGCEIRITPVLPTEAICDSGDCPPQYGPNCFGVASSGNPSDLARDLATSLNQNCANDPVSARNVGNRLIVITEPGESKPVLCLSVNDVAQGVIGGPNDCKQSGCGHFVQVGTNEVLPAIASGNDNFATTKDCNANGFQLDLPPGFFDQKQDSPQSKPFQGFIGLSGVAPAFSTDNHDTTVRRLEAAVFGECSGDFTRPDGAPMVFDPDGLVTEEDIEAFRQCQGSNPDCENFPDLDCCRFDFDGDNNISGNVDDALDLITGDASVMRCLEQSDDNNPQCCPGNLSLPQSASRAILTEITRMHLRGCEYLRVEREGLNDWPENWVLDVRLSSEDPQIGGGVKPPCDAGFSETEGNDVFGDHEDLGLLGTAGIRVPAVIGNGPCDCNGDTRACDGDLFRFTLPFAETVIIDVNAQEGRECEGSEPGACTSLFLFDPDGTLLASEDGGMDTDACVCLGDPTLTVALDSGEYFVLVQGAGPVGPPNPGNAQCSVTQVPTDFLCPDEVLGLYDLSISVAAKSTLSIKRTQEIEPGKFAGTIESHLLVQPLLAFWQVCDPRHAILLDTGQAGQDAIELNASGDFVELLDPSLGIIPGDENFVPGVSRDPETGEQTPSEFCHENPGRDHLHCVEPPKPPKADCADLLADCSVASQQPQDGATLSAAVDAGNNVSYPIADSFTTDQVVDIRTVTVWTSPSGAAVVDDQFSIRILGDTSLGVCVSAPDDMTVLGGGQLGVVKIVGTEAGLDADRVTIVLANPVLALAPGTYWVEIAHDTGNSPAGAAQVSFATSADGDDVFFHDLTPAARDANRDPANCPAATVNGDGWDCDPTEDDVKTDCDEEDLDGDREAGNVAFCLGSQDFEPTKGKDIPWDVACGMWRQEAGLVVFSQPQLLTPVSGQVQARTSDENIGFHAADNFILFEDTDITDVHWSGQYVNSVPVPDFFTIVFNADAQGAPGNPIKAYLPVGQGQNVHLTERVDGGFTGDPGAHKFEYRALLQDGQGQPNPFSAAADTVYWLEIFNDTTVSNSAWFWSTAVGGDTDGSSFQTPSETNWSRNDDSLAFDLTAGAETEFTKIICGDSFDCDEKVKSGLGYRFDSRLCMINGFQAKEDSPPDVFNRWRAVDAPWKAFDEFSDPSGPVAPDSPEGLALLAAAQIDPDLAICLTQGIQKLIVATFRGVAAYDADADVNGVGVSGRIEALCNGAIYQRDAAGELLDAQLEARGICWDNGLATFHVNEPSPFPPICIVHGAPGWDRDDPNTWVSFEDHAFSAYIDPKVESTNADCPDRTLGLTEFDVVFNTEPFGDAGGGAVTPANVTVTVTAGLAPTVTNVTKSGNVLTVTIDPTTLMPLQEWTTYDFQVFNGDGQEIADNGNEGPLVDECSRLDVGTLPGDVNNDGLMQPLDLLRIQQRTNFGQCDPCTMLEEPNIRSGSPEDFYDISRDGLIEPIDLGRVLAALAGSCPFTQNWNGFGMNSTQP